MSYTFAIALFVQVFITKSNMFKNIDPFRVAFNLYSSDLVGWILLALLLLTSLLIYRPFCRGICPVGLILGWIHKIPGALHLAKNDNCTACKNCSRKCLLQCIDESIAFNSSDCIMCQNCRDNCKKNGLCYSRKGSK